MDEFKKLNFYHGAITRSVAESLLTGCSKGTFLIRDSSTPARLVLSARSFYTVKHYCIEKTDEGFKFGTGMFLDANALLEHIANVPIISESKACCVMLDKPYPRSVKDVTFYESFYMYFADDNVPAPKSQRPLSLMVSAGSKEGYMTKQGGRIKSWKSRWFVLQKHELSYYKKHGEKEPIRTLNLRECQGCSMDSTTGKDNCFSLNFPDRTWYMYPETSKEQTEWVWLIQQKLDEIKLQSQ